MTFSTNATKPPTSVPIPARPASARHASLLHQCRSSHKQQARRQRLQQYARLRDENAGIIVYDGEWDENNWQPSEADAWPQSIDESQATAFPDDIDQRPPAEWEAQQWDQSAKIWQDTPLAQWVNSHTRDGIDPIPAEDEPVFIYD